MNTVEEKRPRDGRLERYGVAPPEIGLELETAAEEPSIAPKALGPQTDQTPIEKGTILSRRLDRH